MDGNGRTKEVEYEKHTVNIYLETQKDRSKYRGSGNMRSETSLNYLKEVKDTKPQIQKA